MGESPTSPNSAASSPNPGVSMNPYATITPLLLAKIKKMKSLLHNDQFRGSLGLSLGCGIRMMSLSFPVLCFKKETASQVTEPGKLPLGPSMSLCDTSASGTVPGTWSK